MLTSFCYLGRILTATDNYWTEFVGNIRNEQQSLANIGHPGEVGSRCTDIVTLLPDHSAGNPYFCLREVGSDPLHQEDPAGFPTPGVMPDYK